MLSVVVSLSTFLSQVLSQGVFWVDISLAGVCQLLVFEGTENKEICTKVIVVFCVLKVQCKKFSGV